MEKATPRATGSRFLLTLASVIIVIAGFKAAQTLIIPFLIALFLAILCAPLIIWLQRFRVPTVVSVLLIVVILLIVLATFLAVIGGSVNEFTEAIPRYEERIDGMAESVLVWLDKQAWLADEDGTSIKFLDIVNPGSMMRVLGSGLKGLIAALSNTVLVILILVFMLLEVTGLPAKIQSALGDRGADLSRFKKVTSEVQQYLMIKTIMSIATGTGIGLWVAVVGLDFALVWGFLAFLLNYVPNLGSIIAAVPAVLLALIQLGPAKAALVLVGFLLFNVLFGNVIEPNLLGRRLGLSTLVVFLSLVFWGWVLGPVGMLLSVPLTMIVKILLENSSEFKWIAVMLDSSKAITQELKKSEKASQATE